VAHEVQVEYRILAFLYLGPFFSEVIMIHQLHENAPHMRRGGTVKIRRSKATVEPGSELEAPAPIAKAASKRNVRMKIV
jgi:hypothetical protein